MSDQLKTHEQIGRLEGIKNHLQLLDRLGYPFLQLPNIFEADPATPEPYVLSNSFIPEEVGGSVRVVHPKQNGEFESLETENLNQMLGSFLPGGFKKRWKQFDFWKGNWDIVREQSGVADIAPMFDFHETIPLSELLNTDDGEYSLGEVEIGNVTVYLPSVMYVEMLDRDVSFYWSVDFQTVFAANKPVGRTRPLGRSDPTTNYLWFRHLNTDLDQDPRSLPGETDLISGYRYADRVEFLRCYYASILTLYEQETNETFSRTIDYIHGPDDNRAFVASPEQSQLLQFDVDRETVTSRLDEILDTEDSLRRELQFSKLYRDCWETLFFEQGVLEHVYEVEPFVNHLVAVDYLCRTDDRIEAKSVFDIDVETLIDELKELLRPGEGLDQGPLCLMGYDPEPESSILQHIEDNQSEVSKILVGCQFSPGSDQERPLLAFGEEVIVHSIEHAVSMWTAEEAVGSGSFELWYDVNFQTQADETAEIGIFDSIQGGAGVASEVESYLSNAADIDIEHGLADQTACHTAAADAAILTLLAGGDGDTLYELAQGKQGLEQTEAFEDTLPKPEEVSGFNSRLVRAIRDEVNGSLDAYNHQDLVSHTENRIRSLFETRELARFNAYVTTEHETVEDLVDRPPRAVDLLLHLSRHLFTDPRVRETYQRFADDASGRDISELGERLTALALQCRTACPDCLETDVSQCVHGTRYQRQLLDRRLLSEVCTYDS